MIIWFNFFTIVYEPVFNNLISEYIVLIVTAQSVPNKRVRDIDISFSPMVLSSLKIKNYEK